jgi:hypothetical protein
MLLLTDTSAPGLLKVGYLTFFHHSRHSPDHAPAQLQKYSMG